MYQRTVCKLEALPVYRQGVWTFKHGLRSRSWLQLTGDLEPPTRLYLKHSQCFLAGQTRSWAHNLAWLRKVAEWALGLVASVRSTFIVLLLLRRDLTDLKAAVTLGLVFSSAALPLLQLPEPTFSQRYSCLVIRHWFLPTPPFINIQFIDLSHFFCLQTKCRYTQINVPVRFVPLFWCVLLHLF